MKHVHYSEVEDEIIKDEGAEGATIRWLIKDTDGAENYAMRLFTLQPGGQTPFHEHEWEQEVFILEGEGTLVLEGGKEEPFGPGHVIFAKGGEWHQFKNTGTVPVKFICVVPI